MTERPHYRSESNSRPGRKVTIIFNEKEAPKEDQPELWDFVPTTNMGRAALLCMIEQRSDIPVSPDAESEEK